MRPGCSRWCTAGAVGSECEELADERGLKWASEAAQGDPADVLVIGNRGMHRRVLGSVPNSVTREAGCTVYLVKTT